MPTFPTASQAFNGSPAAPGYRPKKTDIVRVLEQMQMIASVQVLKGFVDLVASLPSSGNTTGDHYSVMANGALNGIYRWSGSAWVKISALPPTATSDEYALIAQEWAEASQLSAAAALISQQLAEAAAAAGADPIAATAAAIAAANAAAAADGYAGEAEEAAIDSAQSATASQTAAGIAEVFADAAQDAVSYEYLVDEEADLASVSPSPTSGDRAFVRDTEHVWQYDGTDWNDMGIGPSGLKASKIALAQLDTNLNEKVRSVDSTGELANAGVILAFMDRVTGKIAAWFDRNGTLHANLHNGYRRLPTSPMDYVPMWGCLINGQFYGVSKEGEFIGKIDRAFFQAGIAPDCFGPDLDWSFVFAGKSGVPSIAYRHQGGIVDMGRARAPVVGTEWLNSGGTQVAPLSVGAFECVVAYFHDGERRVLTPPSEGLHYRAPELAYGGVSARCYRSDGKIVAVSIERPGFVVEDDPDVAWALVGDGQSLAEGSGGGTGAEWPFRTVQWPDHLLTVQNTILPGDIRTGRDATTYTFRIDPATIGGLTTIKPQIGVSTAHGLTPIETMACQLQDDIVRYIGRPQRFIIWTGGFGGTSITNLTTGTENDLNQRDVLQAAYDACQERGWRLNLAVVRWAHGETDAPMVSTDYADATDDYRVDFNTFAMGVTGQTNTPVWILSQPSSFAEIIDDEETKVSIIGMIKMMEDNPDDVVVTGPGYSDLEYYNTDHVHFNNFGYLAQGEADAMIMRSKVWGGAEDNPLYAISAEISGAVITITWSEPIEEADDIPAVDNLGVEVSDGPGTFLTVVSHIISGSESTLTLSASVDPGDVPDLLVQIGMTGQSWPTRLAENVPRTNIRTVREAYHSYRTGVVRHRHALHQRIPVSLA